MGLTRAAYERDKKIKLYGKLRKERLIDLSRDRLNVEEVKIRRTLEKKLSFLESRLFPRTMRKYLDATQQVVDELRERLRLIKQERRIREHGI